MLYEMENSMLDRTRSALERLVAFNTVSDRSNMDLISYIRAYLSGLGIESVLKVDPSGAKSGLLATIGPAVPGGVVLSGHSDVVPVEGQRWTSNPFKLTERGGRLYGRGTTDMKGFLAACLAKVPEMIAGGLRRPIHLAISSDEETTCCGVRPIIEGMKRELPPIACVIVGEPTEMRLVNAQKGAYGYSVSLTGREVHSSIAHQGVSAVAMAARLVSWIDDTMRKNAASAVPGQFSPNFTTCHTGIIRGGTACNITAGECGFEWELRTLPDDDPVAFLDRFGAQANLILQEARQVSDSCRIDWVETYAIPAMRAERDGAAESFCMQLTGSNSALAVSFGCEAGLFQEAGFSTAILGPGSIEQAHKPDEYIEPEQLSACETFLSQLIAAQAA